MKKACILVVVCFLCVVPIVATPSQAAGAESAAGPGATQIVPPATSNARPPPLDGPTGFAVELSTGGLAGGALGLGWGWGRVAGGIAFDVRHSSLTSPDQGFSGNQLTETALALGPWLRCDLGRALDGRVGLAVALDLQYSRQSATAKFADNPTRADGSASGVIFRLGPGIRFWATPWMAIGYMTQISISHTSGPLVAYTPSTVLGPPTNEFSQFQFGLVGRFSVLALF
jgi:hypothetical protein